MARRHILTQAMPGWVRITPAQFVNIVLAAEAGSFTLTGMDVEFLRNTGGINAGAGTYTLTGQAISFLRGLVMPAAAGAFAVGGQDAVVGRQFTMSSGVGAFALTGQDAAFVRALNLSADAGSYTLSGTSSGLVVALALAAQAGAFTLTGQSALFNIATGYSLAADGASFLLAGQNAGLLHGFSLASDVGSFAVGGRDAGLLRASTLVAAAGSYALTGKDSAFIAPGGALAIVNSNTSSEATNVNTATVNLPASIVAGNLLVMLFQSNGATTPNIPSGWSQIGSSIANSDTLTVLAKIASGSEGATLAMTLAASATGRSAHITYQISGNRNAVTTAELQLTTVSDDKGNANPNPPNNAPGWGSVQILWLAIAGIGNGSRSVSSYPTGYAIGQNTVNGSTADAGTRVAAAAKLATAASDNPGTYRLDATDAWVAATLAIRPL